MRILVFGDSITQGFSDEREGGWCNRLAQFTQQKRVASGHVYKRTVINLGVVGDNTNDLKKRILSESEARLLKYPSDDYDVLVLAIGINDSQYAMSTGENQVPVEDMISNVK